jgi:subtilisin family serine protease
LKLNEALDLQNSSEVEYIEENVSVEIASSGKIDKTDPVVKNLKNDFQTMPWGMKEIGVNHAIDSKYEGKHIKIAIIDTGINNHPDLNITGGVSFVEEVSSYNDDNGHGTHVAGTVAALNNKTGVVGAASKSDIYAVKVLNKNGTGTISQVIEGI